jgi:hypothetical protein
MSTRNFQQVVSAHLQHSTTKTKAKKREIYGLSPLVKQIIRCLYPSDIDDKKVLEKPDVVFTLQTFVELFRI